MKKLVFLLCLSMSVSWANTDPHKELKEERHKYMKLYVQEKMKQATYQKELNKLGNLKDIQNASTQLQYYTYVNKELLDKYNQLLILSNRSWRCCVKKVTSIYISPYTHAYYARIANNILLDKKIEFLSKDLPILNEQKKEITIKYNKIKQETSLLNDALRKLVKYTNNNDNFKYHKIKLVTGRGLFHFIPVEKKVLKPENLGYGTQSYKDFINDPKVFWEHTYYSYSKSYGRYDRVNVNGIALSSPRQLEIK